MNFMKIQFAWKKKSLLISLLVILLMIAVFSSGCIRRRSRTTVSKTPSSRINPAPDIRPGTPAGSPPTEEDPFIVSEKEMKHIVRSGDTFGQIIEDYYETQKKPVFNPRENLKKYGNITRFIASFNKMKPNDTLFPGMEIRLPVLKMMNGTYRPFKYPFKANFEKARQLFEEKNFEAAKKRFLAAKRFKAACPACDEYIRKCSNPQRRKDHPELHQNDSVKNICLRFKTKCHQGKRNECPDEAMEGARQRAVSMAIQQRASELSKVLGKNPSEIIPFFRIKMGKMSISEDDWDEDLNEFGLVWEGKIEVIYTGGDSNK